MTFDKPLDFKNMKSSSKRSWNGGVPVTVTPEMAAYWLSISKGKNTRPINSNHVAGIVWDILAGDHTSRTIRFHKDGWNCDGQHILTAIVRCNVPVRDIFVEVGLEDKDIPNIDVGHSRSFAVTSRIAGLKASGADSSLALALEYGLQNAGKATHTSRRKLVEKYKEQIDFVNHGFKSARFKPVAMKKAFVDVYMQIRSNPEKVSRLVRFARVYSTQDISGGGADQGAINLIKAIERIPTADRTTREDVYRLTIVAIDNFMKNNPAKKLYMTKKQKSVLNR